LGAPPPPPPPISPAPVIYAWKVALVAEKEARLTSATPGKSRFLRTTNFPAWLPIVRPTAVWPAVRKLDEQLGIRRVHVRYIRNTGHQNLFRVASKYSILLFNFVL